MSYVGLRIRAAGTDRRVLRMRCPRSHGRSWGHVIVRRAVADIGVERKRRKGSSRDVLAERLLGRTVGRGTMHVCQWIFEQLPRVIVCAVLIDHILAASPRTIRQRAVHR